MTTALRDLYQEVVFDHYRNPRNRGPLAGASHEGEGHNPLCGDSVKVHVRVEDGIVRDVSFEGEGCAISTASASLMTEALKGRRLDEVDALGRDFHAMVTCRDGASHTDLGKLEVLAGVREFPARVKCATLAWHTLRAALDRNPGPASTE
jgi:nitrogen fixation NifU-like protein